MKIMLTLLLALCFFSIKSCKDIGALELSEAKVEISRQASLKVYDCYKSFIENPYSDNVNDDCHIPWTQSLFGVHKSKVNNNIVCARMTASSLHGNAIDYLVIYKNSKAYYMVHDLIDESASSSFTQYCI